MNQQQIKKWINNGPDKELIDTTEKLGKELQKNRLTTSQIRQVFTKLKSIEAKSYAPNRTEFIMLKPYIAYAAGRQPRCKGLQTFKDKISCAIDEVISGDTKTEQDRFYNFCRLFEAILAYHRASGGK